MEYWKTIKDFTDYRISNHGRVMSVKFGREKILKICVSSNGYGVVNLLNSNKPSTKEVHKLVGIYFKNHIPCGYKLVLNHIDLNKLNNHEDNIEIITQRENANHKHIKSTSQYTGVYWHKKSNKWMSRIVINGSAKYLGIFTDEYEAHLAYEKELISIKLLS